MTEPSRLRVLIVDDDPHLRMLTSVSLRIDGAIDIDERDSGENAMLALTSGASAPDIVLLDLDMPGMGGAETARRISEWSREIIVIAVSGKTKIDDTLPLHGVIAKPFDPVGLAAAVRRIAKEKRR